MASAPILTEIGDYVIDTNEDNILGKGSWGMVFEGKSKVSKDKVVGKRFLYDKGLPTEEVDREADIMLKLPPHHNVVKRLDYLKRDTKNFLQIWLIIEHCWLGTLDKFASKTVLTVVQKIDLFLQSALGLQHLHKHNLIHRDIKTENILVAGSHCQPIVKLADFGESKFIETLQENSVGKMTLRGTRSFMPPEMFKKTTDNKPSYNMKADVFSLGMTGLSLIEQEVEVVEGGEIKVKVEMAAKTVSKIALGMYIESNNITDVDELIMERGDCDEVRRVKRVITRIVANPARRPSIRKVVEKLSRLRTELGTKSLFTVDTVWKTTVYRDPVSLIDVKTRVSKMEPEHEGAAAMPHLSGAKIESVDKITAEKVVGLLSGSVGGESEDSEDDESEESEEWLIAIDARNTITMWISKLKAWEKIHIVVPKDCTMFGIGTCCTSEGFALLGSYDDDSDAGSQCWFLLGADEFKLFPIRLPSMSTAKKWVSAIAVNDMLLAIGGQDSEGVTVDVREKMENFSSGKWSPAASLPYPMRAPLVAKLSGCVYIKDRNTHIFIRYDLPTDSYIEIPVPDFVPEDVDGASMVSHDGKLYLMGGEKGLAVEYDPKTRRWLQLTPPSAKYHRSSGCCAVELDEKILLCGSSTEGGDERDIIEEYDTGTTEWKQLDIRLPFQFKEGYCFVL